MLIMTAGILEGLPGRGSYQSGAHEEASERAPGIVPPPIVPADPSPAVQHTAHVAQVPTFGALLKRYRRAAGLTQEGLARRAGYSTVYISMLERDRRFPVLATLDMLANALSLDEAARAQLQFAAASKNAVPPKRAIAGRHIELDLLDRLLRGAGPPVLLFTGAPGIGKSRLLREAARQARSHGLQVLAGSCPPPAGAPPFTPLLEAIRDFLRGLPPARLRSVLKGCDWLSHMMPDLANRGIKVPETTSLMPEEKRRLAFEAVYRLLTQIAGPAGTLLLLDDVQWADPDALDLLLFLLAPRPAAQAPLLLLAACREDAGFAGSASSTVFGDLAQRGLASRHALQPLTRTDASLLLQSLRAHEPGIPDALQARILDYAGGVPLLLIASLELAKQTPDTPPRDLAEAVHRRLETLPANAREILGVAARIGRHIPRAVLVAGTRRPAGEITRALDAACRARILSESGPDRYRFTHDVILEVLAGDARGSRRARVHRQLAEALELQSDPLSVHALAYQYALSDHQEKVPAYLAAAGTHAEAVSAYFAAAAYYRALIQRLEVHGAVQTLAGARERLGDVLLVLAHFDEALEVLEAAVIAYEQCGDLAASVRVAAKLGLAYAGQGTVQEGCERLRAVLDDPRIVAVPAERVAVLSVLATLYFSAGRYREQLDAARQGAVLALHAGETHLVPIVEVAAGLAHMSMGHLGAAAEALEGAYAASLLHDDRRCQFTASHNLSGVHLFLGNLIEALACADRAVKLAGERGTLDSQMIAHANRALIRFFHTGREGAQPDLEAAIALSRQIGGGTSGYPFIYQAYVDLAMGLADQAVSYLEGAEARSRHSGDLQALRLTQRMLAEEDLRHNRPAAARKRLLPLLDRQSFAETLVTYILPILAWAYLDLGDVRQAETINAAALARAGAERQRLNSVEALRVEAVIRARQGNREAASRALAEGLAMARSLPSTHLQDRLAAVAGVLNL